MKEKMYLFCLLVSFSLSAQVGINTTTPNSTFAVNGSLRTGYTQVTTPIYNILPTDYYITYKGQGAEGSTFILPNIDNGKESFAGRIYKIKNISLGDITLQASNGNTLRNDNNPVNNLIIPKGAYAEVVASEENAWDVFLSSQKPNLDIYTATLSIPPHSNSTVPRTSIPDWVDHKNSNYDSGAPDDRWWVISKTSGNTRINEKYSSASRMTIVYEYQGPPFDVDKIQPIFTVENYSPEIKNPDIFAIKVMSIKNDGTNGKTRLVVSISRVDFFGKQTHASNWAARFFLKVFLIKKS